MKSYIRSHLGDQSVLSSLTARDASIRESLADLLADLGEAEERRLHLAAAYSSMSAYCMGELNWCEQTAYKRLRVARLARRIPLLFEAVADGRLNLSAVIVLGAKLTGENAEELIDAASRKTREQVERMLADRFPKPDVPTRIEPTLQLSPGTVGSTAPMAADPVGILPSKIEALGCGRTGLHTTLDAATSELLRRAQELLGHQQCSRDVPMILHRALALFVSRLEKRKYGTTNRPQRSARPPQNPRSIPAEVRRAVRARDGDRCTFVAAGGRRCSETRRLEFDHVVAVARGGKSTIDNVRMLCRPHNQFEAERAFGRGFMEEKRERGKAAVSEQDTIDVVSGLRDLGYRPAEARAAAEWSASVAHASLEEQFRAALSYFRPRRTSSTRTCATPGTPGERAPDLIASGAIATEVCIPPGVLR